MTLAPSAQRPAPRFGINADGYVAFRRSGAYGIEAVIWLHESAYGLSAGSHALEPSGSLNPSALYDLNDDGIAVGQVDGIEFGTGSGIIWDVPGDEIIMLGNLDDDPPESEFHAYLLTPIDCYGDLNDDGIIGFDDLLIILSTWGDYAGISFADLDYDGEVGFEDLLIVLSN